MSYGVQHSPQFLDPLPVLIPRPSPHPPVRALDPSQFAQLHARYLLHLANRNLDGVLFPYLHGVEHGNSSIREYFGSSSSSREREGIGVPQSNSSNPRAPDYRGLIWVACEDDEARVYMDDGLDDEMLVDDEELNVRRPSDASTLSVDSSYSLLRLSRDSVDSMSTDGVPPTPLVQRHDPVHIPSSFKPSDILSPSGTELLSPKVPESVSLRNFGIQVAAYARISDIVVYSPTSSGVDSGMLDVALRLALAHENLYKERSIEGHTPVQYNVFVLASHPSLLPPHLLTLVPQFSRLETVEMQELTRASEILPGIFLGNSADVPIWSSHEADVNVFDSSNNPNGYDLVVECKEGSSTTVPSPSYLKRAEDHLTTLQSLWATGFMYSAPPTRPAPNAHSILHLPFPCSPDAQTPLAHIINFLTFLQNLLHPQHTSRRARILIYSHDGYTETSVLALALVMAEKKCTLPEAYLELQVRKDRSFFVHQFDLTLLRKLESRYSTPAHGSLGRSSLGRSRERGDRERSGWHWSGFGRNNHAGESGNGGSSIASRLSRRSQTASSPATAVFDNSTWFNHPKFDGTFPSRVLPYLYLGNLNHAINAHMLHALGITHVVSVGECAILPPDEKQIVQATSMNKPDGYGSLWLEEREGRIQVLDIKNMCDDGMDSLLSQFGDICDWIEQARRDRGKVLVHCRVGVSRSATVTIAYIMKHLQMPLVDAYLIVRSRRLSVLIQPNMRLLFNLLCWEVEVARDRLRLSSADGEEGEKTSQEAAALTTLTPAEELAIARSLGRALAWPFLAREVHRLNAKYIR